MNENNLRAVAYENVREMLDIKGFIEINECTPIEPYKF